MSKELQLASILKKTPMMLFEIKQRRLKKVEIILLFFECLFCCKKLHWEVMKWKKKNC